MKRVVLSVVAVLVAAYLVALLVPYEPDERRPGTRLGGPLAADQDTDWSFRPPGRMQIFVETASWYGIPHSVTTTSWIVDGDLYVPCNACATKRWPKNAARSPDVRLKVSGQIYERRAVRISDEAEQQRLFEALGAAAARPGRWVFRMEARQG